MTFNDYHFALDYIQKQIHFKQTKKLLGLKLVGDNEPSFEFEEEIRQAHQNRKDYFESPEIQNKKEEIERRRNFSFSEIYSKIQSNKNFNPDLFYDKSTLAEFSEKLNIKSKRFTDFIDTVDCLHIPEDKLETVFNELERIDLNFKLAGSSMTEYKVAEKELENFYENLTNDSLQNKEDIDIKQEVKAPEVEKTKPKRRARLRR